MKIQEAVSTNLKYWQDQQVTIQKRIDALQKDLELRKADLAEAENQINLYTNAIQILGNSGLNIVIP